MAVGTKNIRMVQALMQYWRRDLNQSLEDELDFLDHRRDMFIQGVDVPQTTDGGRPAGKITIHDVDRFEGWLFEERRRLVRVTELRCEECWRKSVTARDDRGRTPLHWAASGMYQQQGSLTSSCLYHYFFHYNSVSCTCCFD